MKYHAMSIGLGPMILCLGMNAATQLLTSTSARADVVTDWSTVWQEAVRETGGAPGPISRAGAIVHAAIYDAVNCIERTHEPYLSFDVVPSTTSREAAAAMAAHATMSAIYGSNPTLQSMFNLMRDAHLNAIANGPDKTAGMNLGTACGNAMLAHRTGDGSGNNTPYAYGGHPGDWLPTFPDYAPQPAGPNWPLVTPWTLAFAAQFRPAGPAGYTDMAALLASPEYTAQYNEVKSLGELISATRTADQTEIARFWANDRNGTYKPPGHLAYISQVVAARKSNTLSDNARMFALMHMGMADAGIVAWDAKYSTAIDLWRPISGIRMGGVDGNPSTLGDRRWEPLSNDPAVNGFTPPFPAYISGHATFGAVHAAVLESFYRTDNISFSITSDDLPGVTRSFTSLSQAALENGRSRIYLGVHWQWDADDGFIAGQDLGHFIVANYLRRLGDTNGDCDVNVDDLLNVINSWGPCPAPIIATCPADVAPPGGNSFVNVDDLLAVINAFGPCP